MVCAVNDDGQTPARLLASTVTLTTEVAMSSARTVTSFAGVESDGAWPRDHAARL